MIYFASVIFIGEKYIAKPVYKVKGSLFALVRYDVHEAKN